MAKSGTITAPSGADPVIKALGDSSPVTNTLAGIMRDALSSAGANKIALVNIASRKVTILPAATDISGLVAGLDVQTVFVPDDDSKATSPFTGTDLGQNETNDMLGIVAAAKPALSVESLVNKIEDVTLDPGSQTSQAGDGLLVVVDQTAKTVTVYGGANTATVAAKNGASLAEDAEFVQTLVSGTGRQFGE